MINTDAADYSPLAFGAGLALGLMLILGLPRATSAHPSASPADARAAEGNRVFRGDAGAEVVERIADHRALERADRKRRQAVLP